jgi:hypothetical protein
LSVTAIAQSPQHAVEQRNDRGVGPDRRRKGFDRICKVERLAAQQHHVEFFGERIGLHRRRVLQRHVARGALDDEACTGQFRRPFRPHQERDVAPGLQQPAAEIAADGAGADHENAHLRFLLFLLFASS